MPGCGGSRLEWSQSCVSERRRERARFAEAQLERDVGLRRTRICQQRLGALDASVDVVAVQWNAERLLEGAAEIVGAEVNDVRQHMEWVLLRSDALRCRRRTHAAAKQQGCPASAACGAEDCPACA
jgi:hypothetical protein